MNPNNHSSSPVFRLIALAAVLLLAACSSDSTPAPAPAAPGGGMPTPVFTPGANQAAIYYYRTDGIYDDWVLHLWNDESCDAHAGENTTWPNGPAITAVDPVFGGYWKLDLKEGYGDCANFIIHKGDNKDPDGDQKLDLTAENASRWTFYISGKDFFSEPTIPGDDLVAIAGYEAHWVVDDGIIWNTSDTDGLNDVRLHYSADAALGSIDALRANPATNQLMLTSGGNASALKSLVPHLSSRPLFNLSAGDSARAKELVRNQLVLAAHGGNGAILRATRVQAAKVLDDLYTSGADDADEQDLGVVYAGSNVTVSVWVPTARDVKLKVYDDNVAKTALSTETMAYSDDTGIWTFTDTAAKLDQKFYRFEITVFHHNTKTPGGSVETYEVSDPYSLSLAANGDYSQFVDLSDPDTMPAGWDSHTAPDIDNFEDITIYEAHVRDFSVRDESVTAANRGKYMAFTETNSKPVQHLAALQAAGMNTFHILPTYDISTVNEVEAEQINLGNTVAELCAKNSEAPVCSDNSLSAMTIEAVLQSYADGSASGSNDTSAQALVQSIRGLDAFNWGYDPEHYMAPEGSYATNPDGITRIIEKRAMIMALHQLGYRVAADVVFNHTSTSGISENSILDRVVPGYYHRRGPTTGGVENGSCCHDTATEHRMFEKLMIDALMVWVRDYRFDAFRFDIMSYSPKASMLKARDEILKINDDMYFYGEGWETQGSSNGGALFEQATQINLRGTEIGTFNDRWRDPVRTAGLFNSPADSDTVDVIRLGLSGTLREFEIEDFTGAVIKGGARTSSSSYADDPADIINYVSKHDNETLWDNLQLSLDASITHAERVRIFHIASALPLMAQGVPFLQLGGDLMRSKSLDRNSYDSGDWYNFVDFTLQTNNWDVGLPLAADNMDSWGRMRTTLANSNINPVASDIDTSAKVFREFLSIRMGSPLFRLTTQADVLARVGFHNTGIVQQEGVIVMSIDDGVYDDVTNNLADLDPALDAIVVAVNGTSAMVSVPVLTAAGFELHDTQKTSSDATAQNATFTAGEESGTLTVPARTMSVFVKKEGAQRGPGLKPIPRIVEAPYSELKITNVSESNAKSSFAYNNRRGYYVGFFDAMAGTTELRFQTDDGMTDIGFADIDAASSSLALSAGTGGAIAFTSMRGSYRVFVDINDEKPSVEITLSQRIFSCAAITLADSSEDYPFMMFPDTQNNQLFVRGNHSDWAPQPAFALNYKGQNCNDTTGTYCYQAVAAFGTASASNSTFSVSFKLASDDGGWATQLYARLPGGGIRKTPLATDRDYGVEFADARLDNNMINMVRGSKYSFLFSMTSANPSKGSESVGTLQINRCE